MCAAISALADRQRRHVKIGSVESIPPERSPKMVFSGSGYRVTSRNTLSR